MALNGQVDLAAYPLVRHVALHVGRIRPGDICLIPAGWWHLVRYSIGTYALTHRPRTPHRPLKPMRASLIALITHLCRRLLRWSPCQRAAISRLLSSSTAGLSARDRRMCPSALSVRHDCWSAEAHRCHQVSCSPSRPRTLQAQLRGSHLWLTMNTPKCRGDSCSTACLHTHDKGSSPANQTFRVGTSPLPCIPDPEP